MGWKETTTTLTTTCLELQVVRPGGYLRAAVSVARKRVQMPRSGSKSGFTLVELLLVMVVLATIAALATPALRGFTKSRLLPNTALDLVSTARFCQEQAK